MKELNLFSVDTFHVSPEQSFFLNWVFQIIRVGSPFTFWIVLVAVTAKLEKILFEKHLCHVFMDVVDLCHQMQGGMRKGDERLVCGQQRENPGENYQEKEVSNNTKLFLLRETMVLTRLYCIRQCWPLLVASLMLPFKRVTSFPHKTRMKVLLI